MDVVAVSDEVRVVDTMDIDTLRETEEELSSDTIERLLRDAEQRLAQKATSLEKADDISSISLRLVATQRSPGASSVRLSSNGFGGKCFEEMHLPLADGLSGLLHQLDADLLLSGFLSSTLEIYRPLRSQKPVNMASNELQPASP